MRVLWLIVALLIAGPAAAQQPSFGNTPVLRNGALFTASGSFTVPFGVSLIFIDGCAAGGGNGLGQASANTAGGGGGGAGQCCVGFPQNVIPGAVLTITVGTGVANGNGGNTSVTGTVTQGFATLQGGRVGNNGAAGTGGSGGAGGGPIQLGGGAAGATGQPSSIRSQFCMSGSGGGGGASTSGTAGGSATVGIFFAASGGGTDGGGGGATSLFGTGANGGANGSPGTAGTLGYGGGAGGNGTNSATTVAGQSGFVLIRW